MKLWNTAIIKIQMNNHTLLQYINLINQYFLVRPSINVTQNVSIIIYQKKIVTINLIGVNKKIFQLPTHSIINKSIQL